MIWLNRKEDYDIVIGRKLSLPEKKQPETQQTQRMKTQDNKSKTQKIIDNIRPPIQARTYQHDNFDLFDEEFSKRKTVIVGLLFQRGFSFAQYVPKQPNASRQDYGFIAQKYKDGDVIEKVVINQETIDELEREFLVQ